MLALTVLLLTVSGEVASASAEEVRDHSSSHLRATWEQNFLTIQGEHLPGPIRVNYLEAYCRPGSTDRDWRQTVIPHQTELASVSDDGRVISLRDKLADGVMVSHTITVGKDEIDFRLTAHNPTEKTSEAHWAQPCIRVDEFTGCGKQDARALVPAYARKCFLFIDGEFTRLPTQPWATTARYTPGQVYCPQYVDRNDVNPRPLSKLVPTNGLCGCYSADEKLIMATSFEPYQEIFQGLIACIHNDFRIGGLAPRETKRIRGKIYVVPADVDALVERFRRDFPEQAEK
jgi:hypothetical protein